ncbi:hypothetical protein GCM10008956_39840 [Deinococcus arenae]|uniref:Antitoxin Xre/MbcA/ParS-like toxin-binding domain-containing protein n=1 Tax=Deinococcus arenae TaxID=1452751 RepID=A0A8H9L8R0_9DEIO|nr:MULTISPECIES: hypothetical protein [Deinococcus]GGM60256.1 hypothetical protein GCM10008956_39840 [Deinococcus arenae]
MQRPELTAALWGVTDDQLLLALRDPIVRALVTAELPALVQMLEEQRLTRREQGAMLTLSARTVQRIRAGGPQPRLSDDRCLRIYLLVDIHWAVSRLHPDAWMQRPRSHHPYLGRTPAALILSGGIPALLALRRQVHLDWANRGSST